MVFYTKGREEIVRQNLNLLTEANLKVMLVKDTYVPDISDNFIDDGTADDPASHEISVTGYVGGFNGSGRKALASKSLIRDDVIGRTVFKAADITWTALAGTVKVGGAVLVVEKTNDSDSWLIGFFDSNDITTDGSDVRLKFDPSGIFLF